MACLERNAGSWRGEGTLSRQVNEKQEEDKGNKGEYEWILNVGAHMQ